MISVLPLHDLAQQLQIHPTTARKYLEELKISLNRVPGKAYQVTAEQADLLNMVEVMKVTLYWWKMVKSLVGLRKGVILGMR